MGAIEYKQIIKVGCGIDVHKDIIVATVRSSNSEYETREFGVYTSPLADLRDWCKSQKLTNGIVKSIPGH